jgi:hypothetical protein
MQCTHRGDKADPASLLFFAREKILEIPCLFKQDHLASIFVKTSHSADFQINPLPLQTDFARISALIISLKW